RARRRGARVAAQGRPVHRGDRPSRPGRPAPVHDRPAHLIGMAPAHGRLQGVMLYDCRTTADRDRGIAAAIEAVKSGELAVLPTDTVYGVGADAFTPHAITALHHARGVTNRVPPPVLIGSRHTLDG